MMMSEQQFALDKLYYSIMTPIEKISVGRNYITYGEVVDLLNEQQATIEQLQRICETINSLYNKINHLKEENEQLRKELDNFKPVIFQDMQNGKQICLNGLKTMVKLFQQKNVLRS